MSKKRIAEAVLNNAISKDEMELETDEYSQNLLSSKKQKTVAKELKDELGEVPKVWRNKQRVLMFCNRGTTSRYRHLMGDLKSLVPHSKKEVKLDALTPLVDINEIAEMKSCNNCIFFEMKKKMDCYMWLSKSPNGPSVKFYVSNVHTSGEMRTLGNCLLGSRPIVTFDKTFDTEPRWQLIKEMLSHCFNTPKGHPNSKPFVDHVLSFYILDDRIWFRNFQIAQKEGEKKKMETELVEIGPRMVLLPIRIFSGSFEGKTIYKNADYISPNQMRALMRKKEKSGGYTERTQHNEEKKQQLQRRVVPDDGLDDVFK
eukprot:TRINITY_DN4769_c0_g1_i1.p1 TRINITY_DN4769_c0_g1~~TRINITY_DN4769_c0_g1_i1.p1  ORF type:complete len:314 (-),score=95.96 TRINITY_DN4769_c0_g1_i1:74-1015(-)